MVNLLITDVDTTHVAVVSRNAAWLPQCKLGSCQPPHSCLVATLVGANISSGMHREAFASVIHQCSSLSVLEGGISSCADCSGEPGHPMVFGENWLGIKVVRE